MRKPISHESRSDECDIGFQVQFNAEFTRQVMNFPRNFPRNSALNTSLRKPIRMQDFIQLCDSIVDIHCDIKNTLLTSAYRICLMGRISVESKTISRVLLFVTHFGVSLTFDLHKCLISLFKTHPWRTGV